MKARIGNGYGAGGGGARLTRRNSHARRYGSFGWKAAIASVSVIGNPDVPSLLRRLANAHVVEDLRHRDNSRGSERTATNDNRRAS
jgi:hypothetical protein